MSTLKADLYAFLTADGGIVAAVSMYAPRGAGAGVAAVFADAAPQAAALPLLVFQRIDDPGTRDMSGPLAAGSPRIQLDCYGRTPAERETLMAAVLARLDGFTGMMGSTHVASAYAVDRGRDSYDPPGDGEGGGAYRGTQDFIIQTT